MTKLTDDVKITIGGDTFDVIGSELAPFSTGMASASEKVAFIIDKDNFDLYDAAPDMVREMEALAEALEDTGHEPPQSYYEAIKKARGWAC